MTKTHPNSNEYEDHVHIHQDLFLINQDQKGIVLH